MLRRHHRRSLHRRRRGYALVIFALIFFCLMALGALVIDLGLARMTQRQMQTAVDSATLEGLRFRDGVPEAWLSDPSILAVLESLAGPLPAAPPQDPTNPVWREWYESLRRQEAMLGVMLTFDADLDMSSQDTTFDAGPLVQLSDGIPVGSDFRASELLQVDPNARLYKPTLNPNPGNDPAGDLVSGHYIDDASHYEGKPTNRYQRHDFIPGIPNLQFGNDAFLVRLRRTREIFDNPAVSTTGDSIPYLFGRGSLLPLPQRGQGINVRATSIAMHLPAISVGATNRSLGIVGAFPFGVVSTVWSSPVSPNPRFTISGNTLIATLTLNPQGILSDSAGPFGQVYDQSGSGRILVLGDSIVAQSGEPATFTAAMQSLAMSRTGDPAQFVGFVPIYGDTQPLPERVIGFGYGIVSQVSSDSFTLQKLPGFVANQNASAGLGRKLDSFFFDPMSGQPIDSLVGELFAARRSFAQAVEDLPNTSDSVPSAMQVPALAAAVGPRPTN